MLSKTKAMLKLLKKYIKNHFVDTLAIPNVEKSFERLNHLGFKPKTIYDVGAYQGEFAKLCFKIWPETNVVCFEPITEQFEALQKWSQVDNRVTAIHGLVGEENKKEVKFNKGETASSILEEHHSKNFTTEYHEMRTLVGCIKEFNLNPPDLLKIDTQGYEYQVLNGMGAELENVHAILAELNFIDIHKNVKLAEEVISFLFQKGFRMYDITEVHRRPFDNAIWQTDFLFLRENSSVRASKLWEGN